MNLNIRGKIEIKKNLLPHDVYTGIQLYLNVLFNNNTKLTRASGISVMDSWLMIYESLQMSPNSHSYTSTVVTYKCTLTAWGFVYERKKTHIRKGGEIFVIAKQVNICQPEDDGENAVILRCGVMQNKSLYCVCVHKVKGLNSSGVKKK